ncbi:1152_t:CDS:2, partial [Funneliformis geosporum]
GFYPKKPILQQTLVPTLYPIPNDYIVQTTWRRSKNKHTVQCSIVYVNNKPIYQIAFDNNFSKQVISYKSSSNATILLHEKLHQELKHKLQEYFYLVFN